MTDYTIKLSIEQINKLRHAISLTDTPTKKMYTPYRNYYVTGEDPDWEELVEAGLASRRPDIFHKDDIIYSVTAAGCGVLQEITGIKINTPR